jgi:hypothetical protein
MGKWNNFYYIISSASAFLYILSSSFCLSGGYLLLWEKVFDVPCLSYIQVVKRPDLIA